MTHIFFGKELNITEKEYNFLNTTWGVVARHAKRAKDDFAYRVTFPQIARDTKAKLYGIIQLLELQEKIGYEDGGTIYHNICVSIDKLQEEI